MDFKMQYLKREIYKKRGYLNLNKQRRVIIS